MKNPDPPSTALQSDSLRPSNKHPDIRAGQSYLRGVIALRLRASLVAWIFL